MILNIKGENKMIKILTNLIALLLIIFVITIGCQNYNSLTYIKFFADKLPVTSGIVIFAAGLSGLIAGIIFMLHFVLQKNTAVKAYERQLEKTSVSSDENSAKVKVLEAKIQTLEKALEEATKKNQ